MADENSSETNNEPVKPTDAKVEPAQATAVAEVKDVAKKAVTKGINKTVIIAIIVILALGGGWYYKKSSDKSKNEKAAENLIESLTGNKVDLDKDKESFSVQDEESGESVSIQSNQKMPSDFPKDSIPYLDEKSVTLVITSTNEDKKNWSVTTTVNESLDEAAAYFESKFVEPDYTDVGSYGYNDTKTFAAKSAEYSLFVTVSKTSTDADTVVSYVIEQL